MNNLKELKPRKALNKAFLKVKPNRTEIEGFKANLITLLDRTNDTESEEFHKNLISDFLKDTYYKQNHFINTKGRNDLVIHTGQNANSNVGVIIEAKKPTNKAEMMTIQKLNTKAFQELVLYYLRERITQKNLDVKHLIATNINEWFIFDEHLFERLFAQNKSFVKQFENFELSKKTTEVFYKEIAEPFIESITTEIEFTYFNIQDFSKQLRNADKSDDTSLIALFKLLSPEHLLKLPFINDSNSLDKRFYGELLHIIGLTETKEGSKKLIERNKPGERHTGTILEDAIIQLDSLDKISRLEKPNQFGSTQQERLFNVALELSITWLNRILFLKLLEAQLITYHKGDKSYSILNLEKIKNYDDLNSLFFQVLARKYDERNEDVKIAFEKIPYLNSSLFEPTDIEQTTLFISNLKDDKSIPIYSQTVLKDQQGKKRTGNITTLQYLFEFLDAYDFGAEGGEEIQEDNKTLINASVLGLIFEKINGYKDGSFFTPGFITMYMCRETIRKAVVQKFNESKKWNCQSLDELYDKIEDRKEANKIVDSIKICDPAVGSGHFLVSALNEMIAVKNDLKILQDRDGKRLKEYQVEVVNDELIVTDEEGELFEYNPSNKETQRIQETLFHEKQTIIENCLFGVDINTNSVKICRLRLWIELLKNAYYKNATELETLPNIDINIKCGNSLVSRFAIDADLKQALKKSKWTIDGYRVAVDTYRNAENKEQKREMERLIADIKSDFRSEISLNDPKVIKFRKVRDELFKLNNQVQLFEMSKKEKADWNKKVKQLSEETNKLETEIEEIKANKIYENAFEWRFEFPEVLNDNGDYVGFDVVIGNPPYLRVESVSEKHSNYYKKEYISASGKFDVSSLFIELGISLINVKGELSYISTYQFIYTGSAIGLREFIMNRTIGCVIMFSSKQQIFEDATTYTGIFLFQKGSSKTFKIQKASVVNQEIIKSNVLTLGKSNFISKRVIVDDTDLVTRLKESEKTVLGLKIGFAKCGVVSSCDDVFFIQENQISEFKLERELIYPILGSEDLSRYHLSTPKTNCIYPYYEINNKTTLIDEEQLKVAYPNISNYIKLHESILRERSQGRVTYANSNRWYQLNRPREKWIYDSKKIIAPGTTGSPKYALDLDGAVFRNARLYSFILKEENIEYYKLILGILNSKLSHYFMTLLCPPKNNGYYELSTTFLEEFPYPIWSHNSELQITIISKVQNIITNKNINDNFDSTLLELEIDNLVYQLYGLTEEEIKIIENT